MNRIKSYEKFVTHKNEISFKEELMVSLYETLSVNEKIELPKYFLKEISINENVLKTPEFKLPVISSLFGIAFEYNVKGLIKHGLIEAAEIFSVPFVGLVVKTAGNVATFLAAYELCREISTDVEHFNVAHH